MSLPGQALGRLGPWIDEATEQEREERARIVARIPDERERIVAALAGDADAPEGLTLENLRFHLHELDALARQLEDDLR